MCNRNKMAVTYKISEIVILICTVSVVNSAPILREPKTLNAVSKVAEYVLNLKRQEHDATPGPLPVFSELQDMEQENITAATTEAKAERSTLKKSAQHNAKLENYNRTSATIVLLRVLVLSKPTPTVAKLEDNTAVESRFKYVVDKKFADFLLYIQSFFPELVVLFFIVVFVWFFETLYNCMCGRRLQEDEKIPLS